MEQPCRVDSPEPVSDRSYGRAVILSATLGFLGVHHFYLGRVGEGLLDLALSVAWVACFATGHPVPGLLFFVADWGHALLVTVLLLTGSFRDGEGRLVCYPGQRLGLAIPQHDMRRDRR